jgi:hypothetical protein
MGGSLQGRGMKSVCVEESVEGVETKDIGRYAHKYVSIKSLPRIMS